MSLAFETSDVPGSGWKCVHFVLFLLRARERAEKGRSCVKCGGEPRESAFNGGAVQCVRFLILLLCSTRGMLS